MTTMRWKVVRILIQINEIARPPKGKDWDWKAPFLQLKKSTIQAEDEWHILLQVSEEEVESIYKLCDGRHAVETFMEEVEQELWSEKTAQLEQEAENGED